MKDFINQSEDFDLEVFNATSALATCNIVDVDVFVHILLFGRDDSSWAWHMGTAN
jgi:hypothetical protein